MSSDYKTDIRFRDSDVWASHIRALFDPDTMRVNPFTTFGGAVIVSGFVGGGYERPELPELRGQQSDKRYKRPLQYQFLSLSIHVGCVPAGHKPPESIYMSPLVVSYDRLFAQLNADGGHGSVVLWASEVRLDLREDTPDLVTPPSVVNELSYLRRTADPDVVIPGMLARLAGAISFIETVAQRAKPLE